MSWVVVSLESWFDDFISFKSRDEDIKDPEKDKDSRWNGFEWFWTTKFTANSRITSEHQNHNGQEGFNTENGHRESQAEKINNCINISVG